MAEYTPGGRCHLTLEFLADGPATLGDVRAGLELTSAQADKHWHRMKAMQKDGLIASVQGSYVLTVAGDAKRRELARDQTEGRPSVRIFQQPQGARA